MVVHQRCFSSSSWSTSSLTWTMSLSQQLLLMPILMLLLINTSQAIDTPATTPTTLKPSIRNTANAARSFIEGDDALMTCVVTDLGQYTVMWSRLDHNKKTILTIKDMMVSTDSRIHVLHDTAPQYNSSIIRPGGDVWVLVIKQVQLSDAGVYVCEVNSNPSLTSHYMVTVKSRNESEALTTELRSNHNYTECCVQNGVSEQCLGFCSIHNILEGSAGIEPEACENHFPHIVRCMADHRNHVDCCEREAVPDVCQDLCRGEYTLQEDSIQSHFSCTAYTERTLMCISEGIEVLPRPPESPDVTVLGPTSILVEWEHPVDGSPPPESYMVNITTIKRFDPPVDVTVDSPDYTDDSELDDADDLHYIPKKRQVKVPASQTQVNITSLSPLTWYEVSVISVNRHGTSLAQYNVRALTTSPEANRTELVHPELPDIMGCCSDRGVKHFRCLNNLCNPQTKYIAEPDMIVCAPWATEAFSCLANDFDHSDCCRERGLPPVCIELCSGNVTKIDYKYFRCVDYFSDYRSCLMKGYGVLPGAPGGVSVSNIHPTYVLLTWNPPAVLGESVSAYHAYFRPVSPDRGCDGTWFMEGVEISYRGVYTETSPYVLEHLCPNSEYEVYVQAVNKHGSGDPSPRVLFRTPSVQVEQKLQPHSYNVTACCRSVNISPGCMPLCDYNARMTHVRMLLDRCTHELPQLLRCGVGGRDHTPCCTRRGVPQSCMSLCSGSFNHKQEAPHQCLPFIGNVMMCLEEGVGTLPGPVSDLHATEVRDGGVTLVWQPPQPKGANISNYQLHYQEVSPTSAPHTVFALNNTINYNDTVAIINNLTVGGLYNFFVITNNTAGSSLPSSILTINLTAEAHSNSGALAGTSSAPHSLELEAKSSTSLTVAWAPPVLAHPYDRFRYMFYFRALGSEDSKFNKTLTGAHALRIDGLSPNTQHIIYVTAMNDMGESRPSETLLAWTDPAYPAFVETPTVHPINLIVEGGHMTVLCIAMGAPSPTVSLYISGVLIHQNVTRHMVTLVNNVTRDMTEISCYADNGYGTPMQSTRTITIHRRPLISASETVQAIAGRSSTLECHINAWPQPSMVWWRDPEGRVPVIHGGNYIIEQQETGEGEGNYVLRLTIKNVTENIDNDKYYCHAQNSFGQMTKTINVDMLKAVQVEYDVTECCQASNMSSACIDACAFDQVDFDRVMNRDDCIPDFGKLMKCAADGSDHRSCCDNKGVPKQCLDWCRGQVVPHHLECQLQWAPVIIGCFSEGQDELPGPPMNLQMSSITDNSALITWDIPMKNPQSVLLYRVFWRQVGQSIANKNDTSRTQLLLTNLEEGVQYEVAVKAGNNKGTSILTKSITYMHTSASVSNTPTVVSYQSDVAVAVSSVFVVVILCVILIVAFWWARKNKIICDKASTNGGISFENPSYIKEQNGDTVQIAETPNGSLNGTVTSGMNGNINGSIPNGGFSHGNMNGGHNGGLNNGINNVWNSQQPSSSVPGFEDDLPSKGGYKRFNS